MSGPNPIKPNLLTPRERRSELCRLLALGLVRLGMRERDQVSATDGEFPLHNSADQRAHATPEKETT